MQKVTRRDFLRVSGLVAAGSVIAACAPTPAPTAVPPTAAPKATAVPPTAVPPTAAPKATVAPTAAPKATVAPTAAPKASAYKEAPMLAELVKAGKLPPVDQRLPKDPLVLKPYDKVGKYGGTLRFGSVVTSHQPWSNLQCNGLFIYNQENTKVSTDMAKSYKWSSDVKTVTIELREGQKWSDGAPFTTDDVMFWWEDIANYKEVSPSIAVQWRPGGKVAEFKKVSPTVYEITFATPWPTIVDLWGRSSQARDGNQFLPKHFLTKYHKKYNDKADDLAKEEKFETWIQALAAHRNTIHATAVGRPRVECWGIETWATDRLVAVRNPYFYQVDNEGNQLPYIDRVDSVITGNVEVHMLKTIAGEFDFEGWYTNLTDMPVLTQNASRAGFRILMPMSSRTSALALMPNRTVKDPLLRELFNKRDFRVAMSHGIDRKAINDTIFFGLATPYPAMPMPYMSYMKPEWAKMYIDYDVAKANQLLDGVGLTKKDAQGFRVRPDNGQRLNLLIEIGSTEGPKEPMCAMIKQQWEKIGLEATVVVMHQDLMSTRNSANELTMATWHLDRAALYGRGNPLWFGLEEPSQQRWAAMWSIWFNTGGKDGIEPPQEIKDLRATFDRWRETLPDTPEFVRLGQEYYKWFAEEIPMIGTVGLWPQPLCVNAKMYNVPTKDIYWGSDSNFYNPYWPSQWAYES